MGVFLGQEVARMNGLLKVVAHTLDQLDRAIAGTVVMSADLEAMMNRMLDDKVPTQWEGVGFPSLKPLASWVPDLIERVTFLASWLYDGLPATYWVPAFFFPQGFMTAAMQAYARKTETPIDALQFRTVVLPLMADAVEEAQTDGVNVHGLFLQGAKWDLNKQIVEDSDPHVPIVNFPVIWLEPCDIEENCGQGCFACPLYKTSTRRGELSTTGHSTNFVMYLQIATARPSDYWVRRGAALLCMTDD